MFPHILLFQNIPFILVGSVGENFQTEYKLVFCIQSSDDQIGI